MTDPDSAPEKFTDDLPEAVRTRLAQIRVRRCLMRGTLAAGIILALGAFLLLRSAPGVSPGPAVTETPVLASSLKQEPPRARVFLPVGFPRDLPASEPVRLGIVGPVPRAYSPDLAARLLRDGI